MRVHRQKRSAWVFGAAVLLGLGGVAGAQMGGPLASPGPRTQMSVGDQLATADAYLTKMDSAASNVRRELQSAREAKDVVKSLCLNDKLSQMEVALRSARDRRVSLEQAAGRHDSDLAAHEFTVLDVLRQRSEQLMREASQCIGVDAYYIGESSVIVTVDPTLPGEDTSTLPDIQLVSMPPICASCVR